MFRAKRTQLLSLRLDKRREVATVGGVERLCFADRSCPLCYCSRREIEADLPTFSKG